MADSNQKAWLAATIELFPTLVFLGLWRTGTDLQIAGWAGTAAAGCAIALLTSMRSPLNPPMLGINIHLLCITPLIVTLYSVGLEAVATLVREQAQTLIFVVMGLTGLAMTFRGQRSFIGSAAGSPDLRGRYSNYLLAIVMTAIPWAYFHASEPLLAAGLPLGVFFAVRGYLVARLSDGNPRSENGVVAIGIVSFGNNP